MRDIFIYQGSKLLRKYCELNFAEKPLLVPCEAFDFFGGWVYPGITPTGGFNSHCKRQTREPE
ncbi:hypothetical protein [Pseudobacteroides cellulosolvens]|uniref:hypothetical protein n=1 Tax=Pseudobacteroides cellulosolvens TaxID=35825 RepID=UPI00128ECA31|nr:hypothetical protein [Pseudobacteroides cellulosolvens]